MAVIYCRVSTREQGSSKLGLIAQESYCREFASTNGLTVHEVVTEVASGKLGLEERTRLRDALKLAKKLKTCVLVSKLDRLSRDVHFISGLMSNKVPFVVAELGLDVDNFVLHIMAALSEKERKMIAERTRQGLSAKKQKRLALEAQGNFEEAAKLKLGGNKKNLHEVRLKGHATNAANAQAFRAKQLPTIRNYQAQGLSMASIASRLNDSGVRTMLGGAWHQSTVSRLLKDVRTA
jgi:DNA invertase Pin-like site-specific DNA recombinase